MRSVKKRARLTMFAILLLSISLIAGLFFFFALRDTDFHWSARLFFAAVPVIATFFLGILGFVGSIVLMSAVCKAAT